MVLEGFLNDKSSQVKKNIGTIFAIMAFLSLMAAGRGSIADFFLLGKKKKKLTLLLH